MGCNIMVCSYPLHNRDVTDPVNPTNNLYKTGKTGTTSQTTGCMTMKGEVEIRHSSHARNIGSLVHRHRDTEGVLIVCELSGALQWI